MTSMPNGFVSVLSSRSKKKTNKKKHDFFFYEWSEDELTMLKSFIFNISRDLLAHDACYGCLF